MLQLSAANDDDDDDDDDMYYSIINKYINKHFIVCIAIHTASMLS